MEKNEAEAITQPHTLARRRRRRRRIEERSVGRFMAKRNTVVMMMMIAESCSTQSIAKRDRTN
jgi:hypothetical protein